MPKELSLMRRNSLFLHRDVLVDAFKFITFLMMIRASDKSSSYSFSTIMEPILGSFPMIYKPYPDGYSQETQLSAWV